MATALESVQSGPGSSAPQFQQTPAVTSNSGNVLAQVGGLAANLFAGAVKYGEGKAEAESARLENTALGDLEQKLLDARMAASENPSVDVGRIQKRALSQFYIDHPELRVEGSELFKKSTGKSPSGLTAQEEAENSFINTAISNGWGRHGASREYNLKQAELYAQSTRQRKAIDDKMKMLDLRSKEGEVVKDEAKREFLGGLKEMSTLEYRKFQASSDDIVSRFKSGELTLKDAQFEIERKRIELNTLVSGLGQFSSDPNVSAMTAPIIAELDLAEKIVTGKLEKDAIDNEVAINKARAKAVMLSDPETVQYVVAGELTNFMPGLDQAITGRLLKTLTAMDVRNDNPKGSLPDVATLDKKEKGVFRTVVDRMFGGGAEEKATNTLAGAVEHLNRNGADYDMDDKTFIVDLLNNDKAVAALSPEQKMEAVTAFEAHIVDDVDLAMVENVLNVKVRPTRADIFAGKTAESTELSNYATLSVSGGRIFWNINDEFRGDANVFREVRKANMFIQKGITPAVDVYSKYTGLSFEEAVSQVVPSVSGMLPSEEVKDEPKKTDAAIPASGDGGNGKADEEGTPEIFTGNEAVAKVTESEGELTVPQRAVVMDEGFSTGAYKDDKGIATSGVGQTGEFQGMGFKEVFAVHEQRARGAIPTYDSLPDELKGALISAAYRGDLGQGDMWVEMFNAGQYREAAEEFLNHKEYIERKQANKSDGVVKRLDRIAKKIANFGGSK